MQTELVLVSGAAVAVQILLYLQYNVYSEWTPVVVLYFIMSYWSKVFMTRLESSGEKMEDDLRRMIDPDYNPDDAKNE